MKTTIDTAGRVVVPKAIRSRLGLTGGEELEIVERDGAIEITPTSISIRLVERDGFLVAETDDDVPSITSEMVRDVLEQTRR